MARISGCASATYERSCSFSTASRTLVCKHQRLSFAGLPPRSRIIASAASKDPEKEKIAATITSIRGVLGPSLDVLLGNLPDKATQEKRAKAEQSKQVTTTDMLDELRTPTYILLSIHVAVFLLTNVLRVVPSQALYLDMWSPLWWQFITSGFVHTGAQHLAETIFLCYTFGRLVEKSYGGMGVWASFLLPVLSANLLAIFMLPAEAPLSAVSAAPAGMLGVFMVGVLVPRLFRKPLEVACLTPFVVRTAVCRFMPLASSLIGSGTPVGQLIHVTGAAVAATLVALVLGFVRNIKDKLEEAKREKERQELAEKRRQQASQMDGAVADMLSTAAKAASQIAKKLM